MDNVNCEIILETMNGSESIESISFPVKSNTVGITNCDRKVVQSMVKRMQESNLGWARIYGYVRLGSGSIISPSKLKYTFKDNIPKSNSILDEIFEKIETCFKTIQDEFMDRI